jgi:predicted CoA-binding protein
MRVMVIGASRDPAKFGHKAVVAYRAAGHEVFAVNPNADLVAGQPTYADVCSVPGPIDMASVYLPPGDDQGVLNDLAARGDIGELWLNPGADSPDRVARAKSLKLNVVVACSLAALHG